jgi:hypothetical protein
MKMRFEVVRVVQMSIVVCVMMPCSFVVGYQCFRGVQCLHLEVVNAWYSM